MIDGLEIEDEAIRLALRFHFINKVIMVIVKLIGGLANQMFPYAAGRRLAHVLGEELKLDISYFEEYRKNNSLDFRRYSLGIFNIIEDFATPEMVMSMTERTESFFGKVFRSIFHRKNKLASTHYKEKHFHFDPKVLRLRSGGYLEGYWNSQKYFEDISSIIRKEFTFKKAQTGKNKEFAARISETNSVSIHIRRGDYVSNPKINLVHGACELTYYYKCVEYISNKTKNPYFFIFSDDPNWVRDNFKIQFPFIIIDHNGPLEGHEDMRLMSQCKNNIIANSGFSWWGAWLNPNPQKIVCSPKKWFNNQKYNTSTLIPEGWVQL